MLARVVQVKVHLAGIGVRELPELEVDHDKAAQQAMEEDEIDPVPLVIKPQAPLAPDEREIVSQLEEECLQSRDECSFQIALRVLVLEIEELEHERIFHLFLGRDYIIRPCMALAQHGRLVS